MLPTAHLGPWASRNPAKLYGVAHFGKSLLWNFSSLYFAFYLTEVAGFAARDMGTVLALSLLFNAMCDLLVGRLLSNRVRDVRSAARLQAQGAVLAGTAFVVFSLTTAVPQGLQWGFSLCSLLAFRLGYSLLDVPQNSFMAFLAGSDAQRADFAAIRYVASGSSILAITLALAPLVQVEEASRQSSLFSALAISLAAITICTAWLLRASFDEPGPPGRLVESTTQALPGAGLEDRRTSRHAYFLLLAAILTFSSCSPLFSKLESYFTAFVIGGTVSAYLFMPLIALGQIVGQALWSRVARRTNLPTVLGAAAALWAGAAAAFLAANHLDLPLLPPIALLYGAAWGGVAMANWSLLAKVCKAEPALTTRRYGRFTFFSKSAQAVSIYGLGEILARNSFRSDPAGQELIVATMSIGPMLAAAIILLLAWHIGQMLRAGAHDQ